MGLPTCGPWLRHCAYAHVPGTLNVLCGACAGDTKLPTCRETMGMSFLSYGTMHIQNLTLSAAVAGSQGKMRYSGTF